MKLLSIFSYLIFFISSIKQFSCLEYIQSDKAEFNEVDIINVNRNQQSAPGDRTVYDTITFNKRFVSTPHIIMGLSYLDYGSNDANISFELNVESVDLTKASFSIKKFGATRLFSIKFTYLAIEDIQVKTQFFKLLISDGKSQVKQFSQAYIAGKQRNVQCFLIGINSKNSENLQRTYGINVSEIIQTSYTINISSSEISYLAYVSVNCIEYFEESIGSYTMIADSQTLSSTTKIEYSNPIAISANINSNFQGSVPNSLIGVSLMRNGQIIQDTVRLSLIKFSYQNNIEKIQFSTWADSRIYLLKVGYFHFQMYNCKTNEATKKINLSDQGKCVQTCPDKYYKVAFDKTDVCRTCQESCLTCNNDTSCLTCDSDSFKNAINLCEKLSCGENSIAYQSECYTKISCDGNLTCQYCISNKCITCQNNDSSKCSIPCQSDQFNLNSICLNFKPNKTYCNQFNICFDCINTNCETCSSGLLKCTSCKNAFLMNDDCISDQPFSTYCNPSKVCTQCINNLCASCDILLSKCLTCPSAKYLHNHQCYDNQQTGTKCDSIGNYYLCQPCAQIGCQFCNSDIFKCSTCLVSEYLYNNACYNQQPTGTKCSVTNNQNICIKCSNSDCQTCNNVINKCSSCFNNSYLFNNSCYNFQLQGSFCNQTNQYFTCIPCQQPNCECKLEQTRCSGCIQNSYYYQNQCFNQKPENTYCNLNSENGYYICRSKICDSPIKFTLENNCFETQPDNTYCENYECKRCQIMCKQCDSTLMKCINCYPNQYSFQGICLNDRPKGVYCTYKGFKF